MDILYITIKMATNKVNQIIRAWKDESFRRSLSDAELAQLPAHPAGRIKHNRRLNNDSIN